MFRFFLCLALLVGAASCGDTPAATGSDAQVSLTDSVQDGLIGSNDTKEDAGIGTLEIGVQADVGPGQVGAPCKTDDDCDSGLCFTSKAGNVCIKYCTGGSAGDCPDPTTSCEIAKPGSDSVYGCVPKQVNLCKPCESNDECGGGNALCVSRGDSGSYCGMFCSSGSDCFVGYYCRDITDVTGKPGKQCVPQDDVECACSPIAQAAHAQTKCFMPGAKESCHGTRMCTEGSAVLTACKYETAPEICDGLDNDCNGITDDQLCEDGNSCTEDKCDANGCNHFPIKDKFPCTDDNNACTEDYCAGGACSHPQLNDGSECDDQSVCTQNDICSSGGCQGQAKMQCNDNNACTDDSCDPKLGCQYTPNKDKCDDGDQCTLVDQCSEGKCKGTVPPDCNDKNPCTSDACVTAIGCVHTALTTQSAADLCPGTVDACHVKACVVGKCSVKPNPFGGSGCP